MEKKQLTYLDTSIINFLYADDAPEKKEVTIDFFDNYLDEYDVFISDVVIDEIKKTTNPVKLQLLIDAIDKYRIVTYDDLNEEIRLIANKYLEEGIVPKSKVEDALHLAFATYYEFDILLSWNYQHLANLNVQRKVIALNLTLGYNKQLLLLSPFGVVYDKGR